MLDNNNNSKIDSLFFSVWRNKYILSEIWEHIRLYNENEIINIKTMDQLRYHPHRKYITSVFIYNNEVIETPNTNNIISFKPIKAGDIPESVTSLRFSYNYTTPIDFKSALPSGIKIFEYPGDLPKTCEILNLNKYNQPIEPNVLPPNLKTLFTCKFNQPMTHGSLPDSVTDLTMDSYNHPLSNSLSSLNSLKKLSLYGFFQGISRTTLPNSITSLNLYHFNKPLMPNVLPSSIITLRLNNYNHPLGPGVIPPNVEHLELSSYNCFLSKKLFPNTLCYLLISCFNKPFLKDSIPSSIKHLRFCDNGPEIFEMDSIPPSVKILVLPCVYNHPLPVGLIPNSVVDLSLPGNCSPLQVGVLPESLTSLAFGYGFNQHLDPNTIPQSVTQLKLNRIYSQPIPDSLTNRIKITR
ncbi:hypothetical protein DICPUDRAFT_43082 [Dictyostelium purpureum]|uniref:FNIP repeat-containing protein n=1 Tax=Dictyostelium purpureum TaxID=5786 RepID=F1A3G4_DICPU|nr:uncharacterized protein DICPUDRAFT_43082 [Dictyostelium purpureum]EGC29266.1 hypothetical protein DICPUDRAFT_43082 [Dictyostelium purpureum]|eukprot:XP_003294203.1 hypothetical protein DICPUDRAFT_43082 [Dictyostelium purpureum]